MTLLRRAVRRLAGAVPLALGAATLAFFLLQLAPGDPVDLLVGPRTPPEVAEQIRENYGLDDSVPVQYVRWLGQLAQGDLGTSVVYGRPVAEVIAEGLPTTLALSGLALLLAFVGGVVVGVVQALRRGTLLDTLLSLVTLVLYSTPSFWLALLLLLVFGYLAAVQGWPVRFPMSGGSSLDYGSLSIMERITDRLYHLALPVLCLVLILGSGIARFARSSVLEVARLDFVRTARAKGLPEGRVVVAHVLRNAMAPVVTLLGLYLPLLMGGAVFVEEVFGVPGMGMMLVGAVQGRDYLLVLGISLFFALAVIAGNLVADLLHAVIDPRVRDEASTRA